MTSLKLPPLPDEMPPAVEIDAEFGDLYDSLALKTYALGYAHRCAQAWGISQPEKDST